MYPNLYVLNVAVDVTYLYNVCFATAVDEYSVEQKKVPFCLPPKSWIMSLLVSCAFYAAYPCYNMCKYGPKKTGVS